MDDVKKRMAEWMYRDADIVENRVGIDFTMRECRGCGSAPDSESTCPSCLRTIAAALLDTQAADAAERIAAALFTAGNGKKADRLVLIDKDGRDLGGWGEPFLADYIARILADLDGVKEGDADR